MVDTVLFYYYSSPSPPDGCYLRLSRDVAYRNMFLLPCSGSRIHFEFPVFEDHSYNTICNRKGVRSLIERPSTHEKYIILRTRNHDEDNTDIVGFYRVRASYYQETRMFNNNGFVWGIEAEPRLVARGAVKYVGPVIRQGHRTSWHCSDWASLLHGLIEKVEKEKDISHLYRAETDRLLALFGNRDRLSEWESHCRICLGGSQCAIYRYFASYERTHPGSNMFSIIGNVYASNLYSRNVLARIPKIYLK